GAVIGIIGAAICSAALARADFWLFCLGTVVFGIYNAAGQYYRFAAADAASAEFKPKAISLVLAGGVVGGIVGPELSTHTIDLLSARYLGAYLSLIGFMIVAVGVLQLLHIPSPSGGTQKALSRPLRAIMAQAGCLAA